MQQTNETSPRNYNSIESFLKFFRVIVLCTALVLFVHSLRLFENRFRFDKFLESKKEVETLQEKSYLVQTNSKQNEGLNSEITAAAFFKSNEKFRNSEWIEPPNSETNSKIIYQPSEIEPTFDSEFLFEKLDPSSNLEIWQKRFESLEKFMKKKDAYEGTIIEKIKRIKGEFKEIIVQTIKEAEEEEILHL
jgi:hypothetical protein